jgi:hypothetical protein
MYVQYSLRTNDQLHKSMTLEIFLMVIIYNTKINNNQVFFLFFLLLKNR